MRVTRSSSPLQGYHLYHEIVRRVGPRIQKQHKFFRKALSPGLKVAITLRFLGTGISYHSLAHEFRCPHNTISLVISETCEAIIAEYMEESIKCPKTPEGWKGVARGFSERWNLHNVCGALDGKHVAVKCPPGSGSIYYNYKKFYSIVLMALVDSQYMFLFVDVGAQGITSDGGVFRGTYLYEALEGGYAGLPQPEPLPGTDKPIPFSLIAADAFALHTWMQKPFSFRGMNKKQRIFNYRLSRARRVVENAFGILANRFRCLLTAICLKKKNVESVVLTACILHNLISYRKYGRMNVEVDSEDANHQVVPGSWNKMKKQWQPGEVWMHCLATHLPKQESYRETTWQSTTAAQPELYLGGTGWCTILVMKIKLAQVFYSTPEKIIACDWTVTKNTPITGDFSQE